jgi:hypothetical protein
VASHNPFVSLYWLVSGKTVGGTPLYPEANRLDRAEALRRYTVGSAWFSGEEGTKGTVEVDKLADLAVLSADYFSVPEEEIKGIESVLTVVGGKVVYGAGEFKRLAPPPLPVSPGWSPVGVSSGYHQPRPALAHQCAHTSLLHQLLHALAEKTRGLAARPGPVGLPCECFAF